MLSISIQSFKYLIIVKFHSLQHEDSRYIYVEIKFVIDIVQNYLCK